MLHGPGFDRLAYGGADRFFGSGGIAIALGMGLLIIVGLVLWFLVSQRRTLHVATATHTGHSAIHAPPAVDTAEDVVRRRLANGEIDPTEYERLIAILRD